MSQEVRKIKISEVEELLNQGKSRIEIAQYYGITIAELKATVFSHPKLKNRKAKKQYTTVLEDDTENVLEEAEETEESKVVSDNPMGESQEMRSVEESDAPSKTW